MQRLQLDLLDLPPAAGPLREEVRGWLREALAGTPAARRARSWGGFDPEFSRRLGERGWIGMTWPRRYGGGERSALERLVVLEELLAAGAPVAAHWVADRQSGPLLLRYGSEGQRERLLPRMARGELVFCIGMSEPGAGSDLAAIRSRAERVSGGWRLRGSKLWTSNAHRSHYMIGLFRTRPEAESRHEGMSQLLVDLATPGITVRPIRDLSGDEHFCEVVFEDALVPEEALLGAEGAGWAQVMAELAFERSGPERYLSSFQLLLELVRAAGPAPEPALAAGIGRLVAHLATLREMSLAVAGCLAAGRDPSLEAALVKDLGTSFEQEIPEVAHALLGRAPRPEGGDDFEQVLGFLTQTAPSFSLRGGTREVLRGIIARGLGLR